MDNWGIVQVLACHKDQHEAWRKKPDIVLLIFLFFPLSLFFISCSTWGRQPQWRWNGLLWSALPYCAATSHYPTVILGALQGRRWEPLEEPLWLFVKKTQKDFQLRHVAQFNENNIAGNGYRCEALWLSDSVFVSYLACLRRWNWSYRGRRALWLGNLPLHVVITCCGVKK